jgi:hypothetical protein
MNPSVKKTLRTIYDQVNRMLWGETLTIQSKQMPQVRSAGRNRRNDGFAQGM